MTNLTTEESAGWFTSSHSADNAQCVEVRFVGGGTDVRDSKHRTGPVLSFASTDWRPFITTMKAGTFGH